MSNFIDAVIVDTSALEAKQFDFLGISSEAVPAFYDLLHHKKITLLSHPILSGEIKKHILSSDLAKRPDELQKTFARNKTVLEMIGISPEEATKKLQELSLGRRLISAFEEKYRDAVSLKYSSPAKVFEDYFSVKPPFSSSGSKKSEFPDAFVLMSIKDYVKANPMSSVLVISKDDDWRDSVSDIDHLSFAGSIEDAIKAIQSAEAILPSFQTAYEEIKDKIAWVAMGECFDLDNYEIVDDIETTNIRVSNLRDDIIPLRITKTEALISCSAELSVDGTVTVVDEGRSYYDPEYDTMRFLAHSKADFKNAPADIECEIKLRFDPDDPEGTVEVDNVKINYRFSITLDLEQADVEWTALGLDDDTFFD